MLSTVATLLFAHIQSPVAELDFELYNNLIHAPATINGHKTTVVIDSGAGTSVMEQDLAEQWKLDSSGNIPLGGIGKNQAHGKLLSDATLDLAGIKTPVRVAMPLKALTRSGGRPLEVIIGYEFLQTHILEVDYSRHHLRIFEAGADLPVAGVSVPTRIVMGHVHLKSELTVGDKTYPVDSMIDTGASAVAGLTAKFLADHPIGDPRTPEAVVGAGVGGDLVGSFFRPASLKIGGVTLSKPVVGLTSSGGGASGSNSSYDILIGGELLKRFKITIDYPHSRMLFEPGENVAKPFEADKTGMRILTDETDLHVLRVAGVLPGSTAAEAGVKVGDLIESVDGKAASGLNLQDLRQGFRSAEAKGWDLGIRRGSDHLKIHVLARSII